MQTSSPAASPQPTAYDDTVYRTLLRHLPSPLRETAEHRVAAAKDLFISERHYEVLQTLDALIEECKVAAAAPLTGGGVPVTVPDMPAAASTSPAGAGRSGSAAAEPTPTYLSVMLFSRFLAHSPMYVTATKRATDCNELLREIEDRTGWREVSVGSKGCGTYYRLDKPTGHHYFKVVNDTTVNPIYLCGTIMELDLYPEWFPLCNYARSQGDVSLFHKSSHLVVDAPWPFANREAFIEGYGIDDFEQHSRVIIVVRSLYEGRGPLPVGIQVPQVLPNTVRCEVHYGGFLIEMLSPTTTRLSFIMSIDPKVPNLPQAALNWVSGKILWQMMIEIQKASARGMDPRSTYWQRRRERKEVYEFFRTRFNDVLRAKASPDEYERLHLKPDY